MCLGVPGRVRDVFVADDLRMGHVEFGPITQRVCLEHVRDARPGDYVLVHVGFALQLIAEDEAERIFAFLREAGELNDLGPTDDEAA